MHSGHTVRGRSGLTGDPPGATTSQPPAGSSLPEYVRALQAAGVRVATGSAETFWAVSSDHVVRRLPTVYVGTPSPSEVDHALRTTGGLIASYVSEPDEAHPANAWLYLCTDQQYSLRTRPPAMQRNVRRALRELTIAPLTVTELLARGGPAFCDTRRRNGLDDGTARGFRRYFEHRVDRPGAAYLGAWKSGELAAFLTIVHVDEWIDLGCFSMDPMLSYRPNDGLLYVALSHYLGRGICRVASYGVSSIQATSNAAGLHRFKRKVGFEASPVHRAFVLHPALRPLASRVTLTAARWTVDGALSLQPRNCRLKKLQGMLACMLGATSMMEAADRNVDARRGGRESLCPM